MLKELSQRFDRPMPCFARLEMFQSIGHPYPDNKVRIRHVFGIYQSGK